MERIEKSDHKRKTPWHDDTFRRHFPIEWLEAQMQRHQAACGLRRIITDDGITYCCGCGKKIED